MKNKAKIDIGDSIHGGTNHGAKNKAETNIGSFLHDNSNHGSKNKAETNTGDPLHGDSRHDAKNRAETDNGDSIHGDSHHGSNSEAETNIGDSLHGDCHHGASDSYPLVDPRLEEAHDDGTVVQSTGAERSLAKPHDLMINPPCSQHKTGGAKNKAETVNGNALVHCQGLIAKARSPRLDRERQGSIVNASMFDLVKDVGAGRTRT